MLEELEKIPLENRFIYINLSKVDENATVDDLFEVFRDYKIEDIIRNRNVPGVFDLKLTSREDFKQIISFKKYFVCGKPFYFRFSKIIRQ